MNEPASHDDRRPLASNIEDQPSMLPTEATEPSSAQNLPSIPSNQGPSLPFHVAIADGGLEIDAKIKNEADADKLIQILQTIKPLLRSIYGLQPRVFADPSDPPDIRGHAQRSFEPSMEANKEVKAGMSFFVTKTQKGELRQRGYSEEQIREMKPEDAHRALGLIGRGEEN
jgi:hypothetical protein